MSSTYSAPTSPTLSTTSSTSSSLSRDYFEVPNNNTTNTNTITTNPNPNPMPIDTTRSSCSSPLEHRQPLSLSSRERNCIFWHQSLGTGPKTLKRGHWHVRSVTAKSSDDGNPRDSHQEYSVHFRADSSSGVSESEGSGEEVDGGGALGAEDCGDGESGLLVERESLVEDRVEEEQLELVAAA